MLHRLIARNDDLRRLRDEGYELALSASENHLLISHVPYVNMANEIRFGTLVAVLNTAGEILNAPPDHIVTFIGEMPCNAQGIEINEIFNPTGKQTLDTGLIVDRTFSARPSVPYANYYDKMTTYVTMLEAHARLLDPSVTARTFPPYPLTEDESVFKYADTSSSRAGISALSAKLELEKVAIIGLGGTGSYVLDLVAKTPVKQIHLFDGDVFSSHNAFRAPGAASLEELEVRPSKVAYLAGIYSKQRRGVVAHEYPINVSSLPELDGMDFFFLCLDNSAVKKTIIEALRAHGLPFIDVGMGIQLIDDRLTGVVRTTTGTATKFDHLCDTIPFADAEVGDEYGHNIQIADMNALNAAFAVIKWKKLRGFYADETKEHSTHYSVSRNAVINEHAV